MSLSDSHCEKRNIPYIFVHIHIFREQYTLEITSGQSWHNYVGSNRENPKFV